MTESSNNIKISFKYRTKKFIAEIILETIKDGPMNRAVMADTRKKAGPAMTKPDCITMERMLYHVIIVITNHSGMPNFMRTRELDDCSILDAKVSLPVSYDALAHIYSSDGSTLDTIQDKADKMVVYHVDYDIRAKYNKLTHK